MLTSRAPALTTCIAQWGTIWCAGPMTTPSPFWWCSGGPLLCLPSATDPARDSSSSGCLLPCRDYLPAAFLHLKYPPIFKKRLLVFMPYIFSLPSSIDILYYITSRYVINNFNDRTKDRSNKIIPTNFHDFSINLRNRKSTRKKTKFPTNFCRITIILDACK